MDSYTTTKPAPRILRIGVFYDGGFFHHISNYYRYAHPRKQRISVPGLHEFIRVHAAECEGIDPAYSHIVDAHWYTCEVDVAEKRALLHLDWTVTLPVKYQDGKMIAEVSLARNGKDCIRFSRKITSHAGRERFGVKDVAFWWPRGYGEPALYDATLRILDGQGNEVDASRKKIGIRTVRLDLTGTHSEQKPGRFCFYVNGEKIYIHGSNWTPLDAFHSRDPQHLEKAFAIAEDLNCNMLRCWGGNVYEDHAFFDLCDAAGILVWQDFAMGCTLYPQDDAFQQAIADEVRQVVVKLRSHPSIALWSGNNENDQTLTIGTLQHFRPDPNDDVQHCRPAGGPPLGAARLL